MKAQTLIFFPSGATRSKAVGAFALEHDIGREPVGRARIRLADVAAKGLVGLVFRAYDPVVITECHVNPPFRPRFSSAPVISQWVTAPCG